MKELVLLDKQVGETPLACMERFQAAHPEYAGVKMTYAGRLDPIASGLLLVLTGDAVHTKDQFLGLSKTYECTAILGASTDTYDVLGVPVPLRHSQGLVPPPLIRGGQASGIPHLVESSVSPWQGGVAEALRGRGGTVKEALQGFVGTFQQAYPPYSSKTVGGKQLHQIARAGDIGNVDIPTHGVTVEGVWDVEMARISLRENRAQITGIISHVQGDFRQKEIQEGWEGLLAKEGSEDLATISFTISVSSGTYIRSIVHSLGEKLGTGACLLSLRRTRVGNFTIDEVDKS